MTAASLRQKEVAVIHINITVCLIHVSYLHWLPPYNEGSLHSCELNVNESS